MSHSSLNRAAASFRELEVWKVAMDLAVEVYAISRTFPAEERYGLTAQLGRAAVSVPSNIAEGKARLGPGEYRRFVSIAAGSLAELQTQLELAERLGFTTATRLTVARELVNRIGPMLTKLAHRLSP